MMAWMNQMDEFNQNRIDGTGVEAADVGNQRADEPILTAHRMKLVENAKRKVSLNKPLTREERQEIESLLVLEYALATGQFKNSNAEFIAAQVAILQKSQMPYIERYLHESCPEDTQDIEDVIKENEPEEESSFLESIFETLFESLFQNQIDKLPLDEYNNSR